MENAGQSSESDCAKKGGLWDALAYFGKDLGLVEAIGHPAGRAVQAEGLAATPLARWTGEGCPTSASVGCAG